MEGLPEKYNEGNTLLHEPSGRIHFVNSITKQHYWTATTNQVPFTHETDDDMKDYFGFKKESNELFYFKESDYKRINCDKLEQEIVSINEGRIDGVEFQFSARDTSFWIDFYDGTVFYHENELGTQKFDMIQIHRRDYSIWAKKKNKMKKKMNLKFSRFIECLSPCPCKDYNTFHEEADYTREQSQFHESLRNEYTYVVQFRDYTHQLKYEQENKLPRLPKDPLIVHFNEPVLDHDMTYTGLYQGYIPVIAKEIKGERQSAKDSLSEELHKFNTEKHFLSFYGIHEFQNRSFLVFDSFSHLNDYATTVSGPAELFRNLKGLVEGVKYMHNEMKFDNVNVYGNVGISNVVVVQNPVSGKKELKLFVGGFCDDNSKSKVDDLRGLAQVVQFCIDMLECGNAESAHLIKRLREGRCDIACLVRHPTFWTPQEKLDFIAACNGAWHDIRNFENALPTIEQAIQSEKSGNIDYLFFRRMEFYGSYNLGKQSSIGQLTRFIRNAKTHERELSKELEGRFYGSTMEGLEEYFRARFPNLLIELYKLVMQTCSRHKIFETFDIPSARLWTKFALRA